MLNVECAMLFPVSSAESVQAAFAGYPASLLCGVESTGIATDWTHQESENAPPQMISVNGSLISDDHADRYTINDSSLIVNEVRASNAGIYICGHGSQLFHKLQLNVDGM